MYRDNHRAVSWGHLVDFCEGGGEFLRLGNAVVPGGFIPHERDALTLVRVRDDAVWFAWLERDARESLQELRNIVTIHLAHRPAEGTPFVCQRLEMHRLLGPVTLLQALAVNDHGQAARL